MRVLETQRTVQRMAPQNMGQARRSRRVKPESALARERRALVSVSQSVTHVTVEKETPLQVDAGLLITVTDLNPIDEESYKYGNILILWYYSCFKFSRENLEEHLQCLARDGVQVLFTSLFSLPTTPSPDGPLAILPTPTYQLPRAKPLPKPKRLPSGNSLLL